MIPSIQYRALSHNIKGILTELTKHVPWRVVRLKTSCAGSAQEPTDSALFFIKGTVRVLIFPHDPMV